jgi:hypothetical protein
VIWIRRSACPAHDPDVRRFTSVGRPKPADERRRNKHNLERSCKHRDLPKLTQLVLHIRIGMAGILSHLDQLNVNGVRANACEDG